MHESQSISDPQSAIRDRSAVRNLNPMKSNGSLYVAVVFAVLVGYFGYQWWLNPTRAVKRQLGELAATLSVPGGREPRWPASRGSRGFAAILRRDVHVRAGADGRELTSRDEALAVAVDAGDRRQGGWDVALRRSAHHARNRTRRREPI